MNIRRTYRIPENRQVVLNKLIRLQWVNFFFRLSIVAAIYFAMGNSQAMKAAWLEDILTLGPPLAFLIAMHIQKRPPDKSYPYGYHRVNVIAFLFTACALFALGLFLLIDSTTSLLEAKPTSIGAQTFYGHTLWAGWVMIAALVYSAIPPFILGRMQEKLARHAHEKTVMADAKISKADWMTAVASVIGILGVGMGLWWADAAAALIIGLDVTRDGYTNIREAVGDLMDRRPHSSETGKPEELPALLEQQLMALEWVERASVRLREEGNVLSGEAFVEPACDKDLTTNIVQAQHLVENTDWRISEVVIMPVTDLTRASG
ncbi:cation diffusion facilitator family transporter [Marinobacter sp.]|uniref:cation diffusion facilitator family transporter n=1 Tax=Marinobacter sp. TaxID=50741 RepID=UPI003A8DA2E1